MAIPIGAYTARGSMSSRGKKVDERKKSLSYSATVNKLLLDVESAQTEGSVVTGRTGNITIQNTGSTAAYAILAYRLWTDATTMSATTYHVNYLLAPNEYIFLPDAPAVIADADIEQLAGTALTDSVPDSNMYVDTTLDTNDGTGDDITGSATETKVFIEQHTDATNNGVNYFRVGDLIRVNNEIMEVTALGSGADAANTFLTVIRGVHGSTAASDHADDAAIRLPFFNIYGGNYNRYSVAQTDAGGRFHAMNYFGQGRATTTLQGMTRGSIALKFYEAGYQELTDDGDITPSTNSGLSASTTYYLSISIDGATTDKITFTTSSNVNFGGSDGVIQKLQDAIDVLYYTPAKNGYEKGATVAIVNGDVRVTSKQHLSSSAISITTNTDGTSGTDELFDTSNKIGRFPATIPAAVAAKLPPDLMYDPLTYESYANTSAFLMDDGLSNLTGMGEGYINYNTGEINFTGAPANAEFVFSALHTGAFSGSTNATDAGKMNTLKAIYGNMPNQKGVGELTIIRE